MRYLGSSLAHPGPPAARARAARSTLWLAALTPLACADATGPADELCPVAAGRGANRVTMSLVAGEMCVLPAAGVQVVEIGAGNAAAEYLLVVQSALRRPGATTRLRLDARARGGAAARVPPLAAPARALPADALDLENDRRRLEEASRADLTLRTNARRAVRGARPLRPASAAPPAPGMVRANQAHAGPTPPAVGDTVTFSNAVHPNLDVDCDGIHDVAAVVRAVGPNFAIVEDLDAAGVVPGDGYEAVLGSLEWSVLPVLTAYFGEPADIDGNGVVWVLFTPVVNRTTPRDSETRILGFFNPADLADPEDCPASNGGEILYLLAADPDGRFSKPVLAQFATTGAVGVAAHELAHLISAERRTVLARGSFASLEETWLSEALAHSAETFVGMSRVGLSPGGNYDFAELLADSENFGTYLFPNLRRSAFYLLGPHRTPALGDAHARDPDGISSLAMRGFGWLFLRWFADQYATQGGGRLGGAAEEAIFHDLAGGGVARARGVENVERVASAYGAPGTWDDLLAAWALAPIADDLPGAPSSTQVKTLHLRDVFAALHRELEGRVPFARAFPLEAMDIPLADGTDARIDFELAASTGYYFQLVSEGPHPDVRLRLTTQAGLPVPSSEGVRILVLRTR
ncbi:MAG: hypothetical protein OXI39_05975 [Gemmatimonadota bacterium]|uniref:hypothetical protein n=1 Tax=Candidatus Palauibacter scopulicola TaxID=3056741 RepID=UPI002381ED59|nr:hypothetical protein [Candidatus Palauibacter scopulicola]MDE2662536.1 hypothetical protein [Candidatus Palauibacter scopulicola]